MQRLWLNSFSPAEAGYQMHAMRAVCLSLVFLSGADRTPEAHSLLAECRFRAARDTAAGSTLAGISSVFAQTVELLSVSQYALRLNFLAGLGLRLI